MHTFCNIPFAKANYIANTDVIDTRTIYLRRKDSREGGASFIERY